MRWCWPQNANWPTSVLAHTGICLPEYGQARKALWTAVPAPTTALKSTVMARAIAANKMAQAQTALWANHDQFARWFAPDQPLMNCDDPDTVAFITALGLAPAVILAPSP